MASKRWTIKASATGTSDWYVTEGDDETVQGPFGSKEDAQTHADGLNGVKPPKEKPFCLCGCGVRTGGGRFLPGHDAKLKGRLLTLARAGNDDAKENLERMGWSHFLAKEVKPKPAPKAKRTQAPKYSEDEIAHAVNGLTEHTGKALVRLVETDEFHGTNTVRKALLTRKLLYVNDQGTHATDFGLAVANQLG